MFSPLSEDLEHELRSEQTLLHYRMSTRLERTALPDGPLTVGIDGHYVREQHKGGHFEIGAGKSVLAFKREEEGKPELSALVLRLGTNLRRRSRGIACSNYCNLTACSRISKWNFCPMTVSCRVWKWM